MPKCTEDEKNPCNICNACAERAKRRPFLDWSGRYNVHQEEKARLGNFGPH